jgi:mRNA-degrading endonuclease RelE of RelBE toxin-antitoxin system
LPAEAKRRIFKAISEMQNDPFFGDVRPIKGVPGVFRRRVGDYRMSFTVNFELGEVAVLRVGHRSKFYE